MKLKLVWLHLFGRSTRADFQKRANSRNTHIFIFFYRFIDVMKTVIGDRRTESAVLSGEMFPAEKALSIGLVDKVVQNVPDALNEASTYLQNAISLPRELPSV